MSGVEDTVPIPVPPVATAPPITGRHRRLDPGSWHPRTLALATGRLKVIAAGLGLVLAGGVFVVAPVLTAAHRPLSADPVTVAPAVPSLGPVGAPMDTASPEVTTVESAPARHVPKAAAVHRVTPRPQRKPVTPTSVTPPPTVTSEVVVPTPQTAPPIVPAVPADPPPAQLVIPDWAAQAPDDDWTSRQWRHGDGYSDEHQQWGNSGPGRGDHRNGSQGQDDGGGALISIGGLP